MSRWPGLPPDVLATIMARLNLADQVRTSAVCAGWRLVAKDSSRRPPPLPALWLVLPRACRAAAYPASFEFASFSEGMRRYAISGVPGLPYIDCIGSSEGWLMVVDELCGLHAVNPISGASKILLISDGVAPVHPYRKAILVPPIGGGGGTAVAAAVLHLRNAKSSDLALARAAGGGAWAAPEGAFLDSFEDIAAHDGKLYALCSDSRVVVFDLGNHPSSSSSFSSSSSSSPTKVTVIQTEPDGRSFHRKHLGVMAGELVMLLWTYCRPCPIRLRRCVPEFHVFLLQTDAEPKWVELEDLGGHAILLGPDGFTALPIEEFPELRRNCIYSAVQTSDDDAGGSMLEVVDLQSRAVGVEPLCQAQATPVWFRPSCSASALWT